MLENKKFKLSDQQISTSLANEVVILNHNKGMYFSLNEVGSALWNHLETSDIVSFDELKINILNQFDIDETTCIDDLNEILSALLHAKLVEEID